MTSILTMTIEQLHIKLKAHKERLSKKANYNGRDYDRRMIKEIEQELASRKP